MGQKGKRIFIDSLERQKDLSDLLARIEHLFRNPQTHEVVLYFREKFRLFPNVMAPLASALAQIKAEGRAVKVLKHFPDLLETNFLESTPFDPDLNASPCGRVWRYSNSEQVHKLHRGTKSAALVVLCG